MYTLPNFCRVCLTYDKYLIDLAHIEKEPKETLLSKLEQCVSEVEWTVIRPLLCHGCIKRLNVAYSFKKQCVSSAGVLKNYVELVRETQSKQSEDGGGGGGSVSPLMSGGSFMLLPNNSQEAYNVVVDQQMLPMLFNLIEEKGAANSKKSSSSEALADDDGKQAEEVSIEINPLDFHGYEEGDDGEMGDESNSGSDAAPANYDWEEVIASSKIKSTDSAMNDSNITPDFFISDLHNSFELDGTAVAALGEKINFPCERCQRKFTTTQELKDHIRDVHLNKLPFKCHFCNREYLLRIDYENCLSRHQNETLYESETKDTLTLKDFKDNPDHNGILLDTAAKMIIKQQHQEKNKKKYFIKGMKNAQCGICHKLFSTHSYLQQHMKLHQRDGLRYRQKVLNKNEYKKRGPRGRSSKCTSIDGDSDVEIVKDDIIEIVKDEIMAIDSDGEENNAESDDVVSD